MLAGFFGLLGIAYAFRMFDEISRPQHCRDRWIKYCAVGGCAGLWPSLTTVGIPFSVLFESIRFFPESRRWTSCSGRTGARRRRCVQDLRVVPAALSVSCRWLPERLPITTRSRCWSPAGSVWSGCAPGSAAEYATPRFRAFAKPILEVLAGIPTVRSRVLCRAQSRRSWVRGGR